MRYFYDCEFLETGRTIDLISIGIVAEDGREYYAVASEVGEGELHGQICQSDWLMTNVIPHLPIKKDYSGKPVCERRHGNDPGRFWIDRDDPCVLPRWVIAKQVKQFLLAADTPELWAYYGAYDHVVLCQLWGPMVKLPNGLPMVTFDIRQEAVRLRNPELPAQDNCEHNALADARWNRDAFDFMTTLPRGWNWAEHTTGHDCDGVGCC